MEHLPVEVISWIATFLGGEELIALRATCTALRRCICPVFTLRLDQHTVSQRPWENVLLSLQEQYSVVPVQIEIHIPEHYGQRNRSGLYQDYEDTRQKVAECAASLRELRDIALVSLDIRTDEPRFLEALTPLAERCKALTLRRVFFPEEWASIRNIRRLTLVENNASSIVTFSKEFSAQLEELHLLVGHSEHDPGKPFHPLPQLRVLNVEGLSYSSGLSRFLQCVFEHSKNLRVLHGLPLNQLPFTFFSRWHGVGPPIEELDLEGPVHPEKLWLLVQSQSLRGLKVKGDLMDGGARTGPSGVVAPRLETLVWHASAVKQLTPFAVAFPALRKVTLHAQVSSSAVAAFRDILPDCEVQVLVADRPHRHTGLQMARSTNVANNTEQSKRCMVQ